MKKTVDFSLKAIENMTFIIKQEGHKNFTGALHAIISQYYKDNYFSKYAGQGQKPGTLIKNPEPIPEQEMTQEQICEYHGGTVDKSKEVHMCLNMFGGGVNAPLSMMGKKGEAADYRVKK